MPKYAQRHTHKHAYKQIQTYIQRDFKRCIHIYNIYINILKRNYRMFFSSGATFLDDNDD